MDYKALELVRNPTCRLNDYYIRVHRHENGIFFSRFYRQYANNYIARSPRILGWNSCGPKQEIVPEQQQKVPLNAVPNRISLYGHPRRSVQNNHL